MVTDMAGEGRESAGKEPVGVPRRKSGELSSLVLSVLRERGDALTPGEVSDRLSEGGAGELAYTTVVTILSRLHAQGLVDRSRRGRAYAYRAVADPAQLAAGRMRRVLESEHDRQAVLANFVSDLAPGDESLLRELLGPDLSGEPDE
jgi:predicted transcriptional regulator